MTISKSSSQGENSLFVRNHGEGGGSEERSIPKEKEGRSGAFGGEGARYGKSKKGEI